VLGLLCGCAGMTLMGFADSAKLFWLGLGVMSLIGLAAPSLQGLMTARIDEHSQGQLQGALGSVAALANMIGPLLFSFVFAQSISSAPFFHAHIPGAPFYLAAALLGAATMLAASGSGAGMGKVKQEVAFLKKSSAKNF